MELFWFIVIVIVVGAIFSAIGDASRKAQNKKLATDRATSRYKLDELYVSEEDGSFIGFDFSNGLVTVGDPSFDKQYLFGEIAAVEVLRNGSSVSTTDRGSQLLGAAVGGLALGGIGLLAGALSGARRSRERIQELCIRLTLDDQVRPLHSIVFFRWPNKPGLEPDHPTLKPKIEEADRVNAHLTNAMRRAAQAQSTAAPPQLGSSADEIRKLWDLRQAGAISASEFESQKSRLLGPN